MAQKKNRRNAIIAALAVLVVALAVGGTIAWLTAQDQVTNTFTVGNFQNPGKDPKPDENDDQDKDPSEDVNTGGYLFETKWPLGDDGNTIKGQEPKLTPGTPTAKNPNVGIGANSDDAYVFLYVKNNSLNETGSFVGKLADDAPYFEIEKQWAAVTSDPDVAPTASGAGGSTYVDGLFMYVWKGDKNGNREATAQVLESSDVSDVYTGELFEDITMPNGVDTRVYKTDGNIEVYAFIYGSNGETSGDGSATEALAEAIKWAKGIKNPGDGE